MEAIVYFSKKLHSYTGNILYINLFGTMLISLLDGAGLMLLVPLLSISGILDTNSAIFDHIDLIKPLQNMPSSTALLLILGLYIVVVLGQNLIQRSLSLREIKIHTGFMVGLRLETYRALLQANWEFFLKHRRSDLITMMTEELGRVASGTHLFLQFIASLIFTMIQIGIAFWLSPTMTLFVIVSGVFIGFVSRSFIKRSNQLGSRTSELNRTFLGGITDHFNGMKEIKSNMLEKTHFEWLWNLGNRIKEERHEHARLRADSQFIYKISFAILVAAFIYLSVLLFHTQSGQLLLILVIFSRLWPRFTSIQSSLEQTSEALPAFKSLMKLQIASQQAEENSMQDRSDPRLVETFTIRTSLECRSVSFRYNKHDANYALRSIDLTIMPLQTTAIVGPSGAGKSTLVDIVMGLLQPDEGQVLMDGVPLTRDNLLPFRQSISYVPQDPILFNGTIRENLLLVKPDADENRLWEALDFAAAAHFVRLLPKGLDTVVGDRGVRLSGGERQRIILARAILRKPSILVLDEATSALDNENERKIQEAVGRLKGEITLIIIAHRLSTIRNADQVIVLNHGSIEQRGVYNQLARERTGVFARLLGDQNTDPNRIA